MKMKRWFFVAAVITAAIVMACGDSGGGGRTPPPVLDPAFWSFAEDEHFQSLNVDETDLEVIFGDDETYLQLGARSLDEDFEVRVIDSPIDNQARSLLITADIPLGECWGVGVALFVDEIAEGGHGFQVGDQITVLGEVLRIGNTVTSWYPDFEPVPGGEVSLTTPGFYRDPYYNPLNVNPIRLAHRNTVGPIEFTVSLTQAHVNNINAAINSANTYDPEEGMRPALNVGIAVLGQNQIRIDDIVFQRGGTLPPPPPPRIVTIDGTSGTLTRGTVVGGYIVGEIGTGYGGATNIFVEIELDEAVYIGDLSYVALNLVAFSGWRGGSFTHTLSFDCGGEVWVGTNWADVVNNSVVLSFDTRADWMDDTTVDDTSGYLTGLLVTMAGDITDTPANTRVSSIEFID